MQAIRALISMVFTAWGVFIATGALEGDWAKACFMILVALSMDLIFYATEIQEKLDKLNEKK